MPIGSHGFFFRSAKFKSWPNVGGLALCGLPRGFNTVGGLSPGRILSLTFCGLTWDCFISFKFLSCSYYSNYAVVPPFVANLLMDIALILFMAIGL